MIPFGPASATDPAGGGAFLCHEVAVIGGRIWSSAGLGEQIMKTLTSAQLLPPKMARKAKARLKHAKLVVASARERAAITAQRYEEEWRKRKGAPKQLGRPNGIISLFV